MSLGTEKSIIDALPMGVFIVDENMKIQFWNQWLHAHTKLSNEKVQGSSLTEIYPDFDGSRFSWAVDQIFASRSPQVLSQALNHYLIPIELKYKGRHSLPLMQQQVQIVPVEFDNKELVAMVVVLDVTDSVMRSSALAELTQKLTTDSNRDQLTGLYNRRYMWEWLTCQIKTSNRYKKSFSCIMADIDHFKLLNDTHGHDHGDLVLKKFSKELALQLRDSDVLIRYGGEEFVILLPNTELKDAIDLANRIREQISHANISGISISDNAEESDSSVVIDSSVVDNSTGVSDSNVTCSMGVQLYDGANPTTGEDLLKKTDKFLYQAKNLGRNCVAPQLN